MGYELETSVVLEASRVVPPPRPNPDVTTRGLRSDEDWEQATRNQILCNEGEEPGEAFRVFKQRQMRSYRRMAEAGMGDWFGAFDGARLVADLGLFLEDGLARYQQVVTASAWRRRGICATLVHAAACRALESMDTRTLVLVADHGGPAERIYRSLGFEPSEQLSQLEKVIR